MIYESTDVPHPPLRHIKIKLHNGEHRECRVAPTMELKFIKGKLHQWYVGNTGFAAGVWLPVVSE